MKVLPHNLVTHNCLKLYGKIIYYYLVWVHIRCRKNLKYSLSLYFFILHSIAILINAMLLRILELSHSKVSQKTEWSMDGLSMRCPTCTLCLYLWLDLFVWISPTFKCHPESSRTHFVYPHFGCLSKSIRLGVKWNGSKTLNWIVPDGFTE